MGHTNFHSDDAPIEQIEHDSVYPPPPPKPELTEEELQRMWEAVRDASNH